MVRAATVVLAFILAAHLISEPVRANWFGKRGDKEDLFSIFLQQPQDSMIAAYEWDAESALLAIESIIRDEGMCESCQSSGQDVSTFRGRHINLTSGSLEFRQRNRCHLPDFYL